MTWTAWVKGAIGSASVLAVFGCGLIENTCTTEARSALEVMVTDSAAGGEVAATSVTLVARDGTYTDSIVVPVGATRDVVPLAEERAGVYTLTVTAEGYDLWQREGLAVSSDECHVTTVTVDARLRTTS